MNYKQVLKTIDDITGSIAGMIDGTPPAQQQITEKGENGERDGG